MPLRHLRTPTSVVESGEARCGEGCSRLVGPLAAMLQGERCCGVQAFCGESPVISFGLKVVSNVCSD